MLKPDPEDGKSVATGILPPVRRDIVDECSWACDTQEVNDPRIENFSAKSREKAFYGGLL
jgi:hypothetical protein